MNLKVQTNEALSRIKIEEIASKIFSASDWVELFGIPMYHLRNNKIVRKSHVKQRLPEEWEVVLFGRRFYVFLSLEKVFNNSEVTSRIKITPSQVELILATDFSKKGVQRNLSKQLNCSESHLSRIRRGIRRSNFTKAQSMSVEEKKKLFLSRNEIQTFFEKMLTVKEFFVEYGHQYKIKRLQDIYHMSANRRYFSLPIGWHSIRVGNSWLLYQNSSNIL